MRVLWVITTFPTPDRPAAGVFLRELARNMGRQVDLEVLWMVPRFPPLPRYAEQRWIWRSLDGSYNGEPFRVRRQGILYVPTKGMPENAAVGLGVLQLSLSALWAVVSRRPSPDVVHAHMGLNTLAGRVIARWLGVPLVTTVHGSDINTGTQVRPGNSVRRWVTVHGLRASERVMGVSGDLCRKVEQLGVARLNIRHIPNGFDGSRFHPMDRLVARNRLGLPGEGTVVLAVGHLARVKGTDILIDAFDRLRTARGTVRLVCVGGGPEAQWLESEIRARGLQDRVVLAGYRPHEEVPLWMNACDLFVMGSRSEGWPTVLSEVLACGRPVVATAVGGVPEIVNDSVGELVEPENPQALADAMDRTLQRPFDPAAISAYAQQFEWGQIVPQVLNVYSDAVVSWKERRTRPRAEVK